MTDPHRTCLLATLLLGAAATRAFAADPLPALDLDLPQTSVSGLSSGAYMAGQFHIAFSGTIVGAAIIAGGPFDCAEGRLDLALFRCMQTSQGEPDPSALLSRAQSLASAGAIDPLSNLVGDRLYVFAGTADDTVLPSVGAKIPPFYTGAGVPPANIRFVGDLDAGHAFITEDGPVPCAMTGAPFVNDCDLDQAQQILEQIYGPLNPPAASVHSAVAFDQTTYIAAPEGKGMATTGRVYIPAACAAGTTCRLHIAFHGCKQNEQLVGDAFYAGAGFNRWAETNNIVVLYPQSHDSPGNPNACWDWWGYTGSAHATKTGVQMAAVHRMMLALAGQDHEPPTESCTRHDGWNITHWQVGRAVVCGWGFACAAGSGDVLGTFFGVSTIYEHPAGFFTGEPCAEPASAGSPS